MMNRISSSAVLAAAMRPSTQAPPPPNFPTAAFIQHAARSYAGKRVRLAFLVRTLAT